MTMENKEIKKQSAPSPADAERTKLRRVYVPRVDIYETGDALVLLADMPGVGEKSVELTLEKDVLTIRGLVKPRNYPGYSAGFAEYREDGDYERVFSLSEEVSREKIEASVKNGVLKVILPKAEPAKARKIAITAG